MTDSSGAFATALPVVLANALVSAKSMCETLNAAKVTEYTNAFNAVLPWVINGNQPATNLPAVPGAYEVGYVTDPSGNEWPYPLQGTTPVCPALPVPGVNSHPTGTMMIGTQLESAPGWWSADTGDTTPNNFIGPGTARDGVHGLWQKYDSAVGQGWFKKVG